MKARLRKGWIPLLAAALMAAGIAAAETAGTPKETAATLVPVLELPALETGTITEIPVDQDSLSVSIPPTESCYLYPEEGGEPTGYADPSLTVNLGRGRIYDTDYMYARVKIVSPSQLRTIMSSPVGAKNTIPGHDLAKRVNAVIAINGDFCGGDNITRGALMRQGEVLRLRCNGQFDLLMIDRAGDFHILESAEDKDVEAVLDQAVNIFTFGPALVVNGVPKYGVKMNHIGSGKLTQRMAICQTGPLEYLLITCEGPENEGSKGLTVDQFVDLVSSIPGVQNAYNLDGGSSATMVFRLEGKNWRKINALSSGKVRPLKDIIYFASAYEGNDE